MSVATDFARQSLFTRIDKMSLDELNALPQGAIQLDRDGRILKFNQYESDLSGIAAANAVGKSFFKEVAPCTDVKEFHGRFKEGVAKKELRAKFRYHFAFKQNPRDVTVTLFYSDVTDSVWVFVEPVGLKK